MARFTDSCAIIEYPCIDGDKYINPCNCSSYLQCNHGFSIFIQPCPLGTAWNHEDKRCYITSQVITRDKLCKVNNPWQRCKTVNGSQTPSTLRKICSQNSNNGNGAENDDDGGDGGGGGSAAAVVGGVLGGLLILIIIGIIVYVFLRKKSLPEWFRSVRETYKSSREDRQSETAEEVYDVIDEKQVSVPKPVDNPGYEKHSKSDDIAYNNITTTGSHNATREERNSDNGPYSTLKPDDYNDINRSYSTLRASQEEDLSRSISVNGADIPVQDNEGYFIGYPSGTVPRQPSPVPTSLEDDVDGYSLGKAPEPDVEAHPISRLPSDYFVLQPSYEA